MVNSGSAEFGQALATRWRVLAERRLDYLMALQESGRWKIYFNEPDFHEAIREARGAVKMWERLAPAVAVQDENADVPTKPMPPVAPAPQAAGPVFPVSPFADLTLAHRVETEDDLREA